MKKLFLPILMIVIISVVTSCHNNNKKESVDSRQVVFMKLSKSDTIEVTNLMNTLFEHLKVGQMDEAVGMIKFLDGDTIKDAPEEFLRRTRTSLNMARGVRYEINHIKFLHEKDCEVKFTTILFEKEHDDPAPNTLSFVIKPVRRDGKWYLTMADSEDLNTRKSVINKLP